MTSPKNEGEREPLTFEDFQQRARMTNQFGLEEDNAFLAPVLGLAAKAGSILDSHKRYLRDAIDKKTNMEFLQEELGDILWYVATVSSVCGFSMGSLARDNMKRAKDLYLPAGQPPPYQELPHFEVGASEWERFPRQIAVSFSEEVVNGRPQAKQEICHLSPTAVVGRSAKCQLGASLGLPLTDNSTRADGYRYHDAIHLAFMAVLGWSPIIRSLLELKRKSNPKVDENEDGARAKFAEEGLSAVLSRLAKRRMGFLGETCVDGVVVEIARAASYGLEVETVPGWAWRKAISQGFKAMSQLTENKGGVLLADLDQRTLSYHETYPPKPLLARHVSGSDFKRAVQVLHAEKTRGYGIAWKKRGEQVSILSNIARKVDRLEMAKHGGQLKGESLLDTVVDLFVYCVKYQTYISDSNIEIAQKLYQLSHNHPYSEALSAFDEAVGGYSFKVEGSPIEIYDAISAAETAFSGVEKVAASHPMAAEEIRFVAIRTLTDAAHRLVVTVITRDPASAGLFIDNHIGVYQ